MSTNPRATIAIRLTPRQIKAVRAVIDGFVRRRNTNLPGMIGLGAEELDICEDVLMHLPVLVPAAATDNQQLTTNNR